MVRQSVDLPEPEGPTTIATWPRGMRRSMSFSAWKSPKCLLTFSRTIRSSPGAARGRRGAASSRAWAPWGSSGVICVMALEYSAPHFRPRASTGSTPRRGDDAGRPGGPAR